MLALSRKPWGIKIVSLNIRFTCENNELVCRLSEVRAEKEVAIATLSETLDAELRAYKYRKIQLCAREEEIIEKQIELKTVEDEWPVLVSSDDHPQKQAELDALDVKESRLRSEVSHLECELPVIRNTRSEIEKQLRSKEASLEPKGGQNNTAILGIPWPGTAIGIGRLAERLYQEKIFDESIEGKTAAIRLLCSLFIIGGRHPDPENIRKNLATEKSRSDQ